MLKVVKMFDAIIALLLCIIIFCFLRFIYILKQIRVSCADLIPLNSKLENVIKVANQGVYDIKAIVCDLNGDIEVKLKRATYLLEDLKFMSDRAEKTADSLYNIIEIDRDLRSKINSKSSNNSVKFVDMVSSGQRDF